MDPKSVLSFDSLRFVHSKLDKDSRYQIVVNFTTILTTDTIFQVFPWFYEEVHLLASSLSVVSSHSDAIYIIICMIYGTTNHKAYFIV